VGLGKSDKEREELEEERSGTEMDKEGVGEEEKEEPGRP
jgi:hypothetical protein